MAARLTNQVLAYLLKGSSALSFRLATSGNETVRTVS